jgi:hypothetical protein
MFDLQGLTSQILEFAAGANGVALNPFVLAMPVVAALAIITGLAGRVAISLEDLRHRRVRSRAG